MEAWPLSLEPARRADAEHIADISRTRIEYDLWQRWHPPRIREAMLDRDTEVIVARSGVVGAPDELVGFGILQLLPAPASGPELEEAHLLLFGVRDTWARRGVGRRLLRFLEEEARVAGVGAVVLEVRALNSGARAFYRALGYAEIARLAGYYQGREDAIRMRSNLTARTGTQRPPGT